MRMKKLLFASQNQNKAREVRQLLEDQYELITLSDILYHAQLEEPFDTFEENAKYKSKQGYELFGLPCFAEDAGLVIEALQGRPGVQSARYAGNSKNADENIDKVLAEMKQQSKRTAYFTAVIAYFDGNHYKVFEGRINGTILPARSGSGGFGYDPIFMPHGFVESFGTLPEALKNKISHRSKAMAEFIHWLKSKAEEPYF